MKSIRATATRTLTAGLGGLLLALNAVVYAFGVDALSRAFDARLVERARALATLVVQKGPYVELKFADGLMPEYVAEDAPEYFQVWVLGAGGGVLERSERLGTADLPGPAALTDPRSFVPVALPDGRSGRAVSVAAEIHEYEPTAEDGKSAARRAAAITVAVGREGLAHAKLRLAGWLLAADVLFALGSAVVVTLTLRRGFAPIAAFAEQLGAVRRPDQRPVLDSLDAPRELTPVVESVEAMLGHLRDAFARERRLSSNIAHELRTPVAELRLAADIALGRPDDVAGLQHAVREARDIAIEMERTVTTLLRLWRDEQAREVTVGSADLGAVAVAALRAAAPVGAQRGVSLPTEALESVEVAVAERPLALVLSNLAQNAAAHARAGTGVTVRLGADAAHAHLELSNEFEGEVDAARVFEPYYSTRRGPDHAGLGLPLARALCEAAGMDLVVSTEAGRFTARLSAPCAAGQGAVRT